MRTYYLLISLLAALRCLSPPAGADPFYLRYDPDETWPEQEGWTRFMTDPDGALDRFIQDGAFHLDTRGSTGIWDLYEVVSSAFILAPEEELHVRWRMETVESQTNLGWSDVCVAIINEDAEYAQFYLAPSFMSVDESNPPGADFTFAFEQGVPHEYHFVTSDMSEYNLYIDDVHVFNSTMGRHAWRDTPRIAFGDTRIGYSSYSVWDYIEIAVIPEPSCIATLLLLSTLTFHRKGL